jgi:translation initiation factor 2 beta subunit (eIF-2beta)/eIF-5
MITTSCLAKSSTTNSGYISKNICQFVTKYYNNSEPSLEKENSSETQGFQQQNFKKELETLAYLENIKHGIHVYFKDFPEKIEEDPKNISKIYLKIEQIVINDSFEKEKGILIKYNEEEQEFNILEFLKKGKTKREVRYV